MRCLRALPDPLHVKRENNFDIVRLALATVVVFFHCSAVSQSPQLEWIPRFASGELAVQGFFAISGFLIFASWERTSSVRDYAIKRAYRILPAYWLATALCVAIAFSYGVFRVGPFLFANLTFLNFLHGSIDGVFEFNPYTSVMNGALWTIKVELMFYVAVPLIVWCCRRLQRDAVLWTLFAASVLLHIFGPARSKWQVELPGQLCFFMVGALIHYHLEWFLRRGWWVMLAAAASYGVWAGTGWYVFRPLSIAPLTLGAALLLPVVRGPTRWGDFSYGTYVLHWPIIQTVVALGLYQYHPWLAVGVTLVLLASAATFSWFVIEKPSLAKAHAHAKRLKRPIPAIISS